MQPPLGLIIVRAGDHRRQSLPRSLRKPHRISIPVRPEELRTKRKPGLDTRQTSCGPPPGNTLRTFSRLAFGGLPHFLNRLSRALDGITWPRHRQRRFSLPPFTPKRRQDIGRDPLHDRELILVRRFHQELAHAGFAVSADDVSEGIW